MGTDIVEVGFVKQAGMNAIRLGLNVQDFVRPPDQVQSAPG
jgi:hypothetical protein